MSWLDKAPLIQNINTDDQQIFPNSNKLYSLLKKTMGKNVLFLCYFKESLLASHSDFIHMVVSFPPRYWTNQNSTEFKNICKYLWMLKLREKDEGTWGSFHHLSSFGVCLQGRFQTLTEYHVSQSDRPSWSDQVCVLQRSYSHYCPVKLLYTRRPLAPPRTWSFQGSLSWMTPFCLAV